MQLVGIMCNPTEDALWIAFEDKDGTIVELGIDITYDIDNLAHYANLDYWMRWNKRHFPDFVITRFNN